MRRVVSSTSQSAAVVTASGASLRHMNFPGWKTSLSTGDGRSKEQREIDRKARHLDKLPKALALHAPQYPYERSVLSDHMMQPLVFEDHLDTPSLFMNEGPSNFFVYWNANDCARTQYPEVPAEDYRVCSTDSAPYKRVAVKGQSYLRKHQIVPTYFSSATQRVNMAAVFSGTYDVRARTDDEGNLIPPPPPETSLHARNYWFTAHYGNYIDLHEVQQAPSIFLNPPKADIEEDAYYTFVMASPDYPYRTDPDATFMLNYVVANIPAAAVNAGAPRSGTVVVPFAPPLPTEDAGVIRQLCFLYKQKGGKIASPALRAMADGEEKQLLPFAQRSAFRFHDTQSEEGKALRAEFAALAAVEEALPSAPDTVTFFHTKWDIQVQEYYERIGEPEPAYTHDDKMEAQLNFLARDRESFAVRSRYLADGTVNNGDNHLNFIQNAETRIEDHSGSTYRSRRHLLGHNGKEKILFRGEGKL